MFINNLMMDEGNQGRQRFTYRAHLFWAEQAAFAATRRVTYHPCDRGCAGLGVGPRFVWVGWKLKQDQLRESGGSECGEEEENDHEDEGDSRREWPTGALWIQSRLAFHPSDSSAALWWIRWFPYIDILTPWWMPPSEVSKTAPLSLSGLVRSLHSDARWRWRRCTSQSHGRWRSRWADSARRVDGGQTAVPWGSLPGHTYGCEGIGVKLAETNAGKYSFWRRLLWKVRIQSWKTIFLYNPMVSGFHVNLQTSTHVLKH